jgi:signal peptidase II
LSNNIFKRYPQIKPILYNLFTVLILDQVTKYLARIFLQPKHSVAVIDNFFRLTYVENPGIAFGVRINNKVFFTVLTIFAVILIFYYLIALRNQKTLRFAFALILGGAFGNLIDRFIYGSVVDFFDFEFFNINIPPFKFLFFHFNGYMMDRWPVFNIADSAVTMGMILIIVNVFLSSKSPEKKSDAIPENH